MAMIILGMVMTKKNIVMVYDIGYDGQLTLVVWDMFVLLYPLHTRTQKNNTKKTAGVPTFYEVYQVWKAASKEV